jgi:hypothetical protein
MSTLTHQRAFANQPQAPHLYGVVGDYFTALGIPLRAGRFFHGSEFSRKERICIVDETFALRNWPNANPVGQLVYDGAEIKPGDEPFTVIGVVGAVKQSDLTESLMDGAIYFPFQYNPLSADQLYVVIRTSQSPQVLSPMLQKVINAIEPAMPIQDLRTMETRITDTLMARRTPLLLAVIFASMALALAAIGTYGVLSFAVTQRQREIGIRMALGALPRLVGRQFLLLGMRLLLVGISLGMLGAWMTGRAMQWILFNVPPFQMTTLAGATLVLAIATLMACLLPAWRAIRIDPVEALREA